MWSKQLNMFEKLITIFENNPKETFTKEQIIKIIRGEIDNQFNNDIESNNIKLLVSSGKLVQGNEVSVLPLKVFKVLHYLIKNKNKCISRNSLIKNCWENDIWVTERTVDVHICKIKNILKDKSKLITRKGYGYEWAEK